MVVLFRNISTELSKRHSDVTDAISSLSESSSCGPERFECVAYLNDDEKNL